MHLDLRTRVRVCVCVYSWFHVVWFKHARPAKYTWRTYIWRSECLTLSDTPICGGVLIFGFGVRMTGHLEANASACMGDPFPNAPLNEEQAEQH